MFNLPSFAQIKTAATTEHANLTGVAFAQDSDVDIRACGMAAQVEGLYQHQSWIARQLFVATADEYGLRLHAERLSLPRLGAALATGSVVTRGVTSGVALPVDSRLTDGRGNYWATTAAVTLTPAEVTVPVVAVYAGATGNSDAGASLNWVSPVAGQQSAGTVVTLSGGSDGETLESWRARLLAAERLGISQGREVDIVLAARAVPGVLHVYPFNRRRGLGSFDLAVTAVGVGGFGAVPAPALLAAVQTAIEAAAPAHEDVRAYAPDVLLQPISAVVTASSGLTESEVTTAIHDYLAALGPGEPYRVSVLSDRILALPGAVDVTLTPAINVTPDVSVLTLGWLRPGIITVSIQS